MIELLPTSINSTTQQQQSNNSYRQATTLVDEEEWKPSCFFKIQEVGFDRIHLNQINKGLDTYTIDVYEIIVT